MFIRTLGQCLGLSDLWRVQDTLWKASTRWYNLGLGLDISPDSLDSTELANAGNPDCCFRAMLTKWLREHQRPTWSALAEALRSPSIGRSYLAEQIQHQPIFSADEQEKIQNVIGRYVPTSHTLVSTVIYIVVIWHYILSGAYAILCSW